MSIFKKVTEHKHLSISLLLYHVFILVVVLLNFQNGKWFLGWDSVNPEFNFPLNIERAIFASWQENYGVGLMGGHGFAATLPHTLAAAFISLFLPIESIRLVFTFFCWYLGGLGIFFLITLLLKNILELSKNQESFFSYFFEKIHYVSLLGSFYYLVNLGTVQIFSIQLEAFVIHFAFLPWLFWVVIKLLREGYSKSLLFLFFIINFFASGQGFIPSLFVAYFSSLVIFLLTYLFFLKLNHQSVKRAIAIIFITVAINSYWLFSFAYFTVTRGSETSFAYNNLISTPEMKDKSVKYGDLKNAALINGFYWESFELGGYVQEFWKDHHENWLVPVFGYFVFTISLIGAFSSWLVFRDGLSRSLSLVFLYLFSNLAIATFPFDHTYKLLNSFLPVLAQAFRTTFTKLGLGVAFSMSVFFSLGVFFILMIFNKYFHKKIQSYVFFLLSFFLISLLLYAKPIFDGNFLFKKMLISLPGAYIEVMDYFKNQPNGRIADLPQNCADGWYGYNWNYFGSGFYWYGVKQPFMSRSFDVWSRHNENYYWQINQALVRQDFKQVDTILDSYDVDWVLYDPNVFNCRDKKSIFNNDDLIKYLDNHSEFLLEKQINTGVSKEIRIYKRIGFSNNFVKLIKEPLNIGPQYEWTDFDVMSGAYITNENENYDLYFPFRELFTKRGDAQRSFKISENGEKISISTFLPVDLIGNKIALPSFSENESHYPIKIELEKSSDDEFSVILHVQKPKMYVDGTLLNSHTDGFILGVIKNTEGKRGKLLINGEEGSWLENDYLGFFSLDETNMIEVSLFRNGKEEVLFSWKESESFKNDLKVFLRPETLALPNYTKGELVVEYDRQFNTSHAGKIITNFGELAPTSCGLNEKIGFKNEFEILDNSLIRLIAKDGAQCLKLFVDGLSTNSSYLMSVDTRNLSGQNLRLKILNKGNATGIDLLFNADQFFERHYVVIPPTFKNEIGYEFVFENKSFSKSTTNDISNVYLWDFPYDFIKNIRVEKFPFFENPVKENAYVLDVNHPNPAFYVVNLSDYFEKNYSYLSLHQSFASEWIAIQPSEEFPYFEVLEDKVILNNWANAWQLPEDLSQDQVIYIFFWPQLLQYLGFGLLLALPCFFLLKMR